MKNPLCILVLVMTLSIFLSSCGTIAAIKHEAAKCIIFPLDQEEYHCNQSQVVSSGFPLIVQHAVRTRKDSRDRITMGDILPTLIYYEYVTANAETSRRIQAGDYESPKNQCQKTVGILRLPILKTSLFGWEVNGNGKPRGSYNWLAQKDYFLFFPVQEKILDEEDSGLGDVEWAGFPFLYQYVHHGSRSMQDAALVSEVFPTLLYIERTPASTQSARKIQDPYKRLRYEDGEMAKRDFQWLRLPFLRGSLLGTEVWDNGEYPANGGPYKVSKHFLFYPYYRGLEENRSVWQ